MQTTVPQTPEFVAVFADHCPTNSGFSLQMGRCVNVSDTRITWYTAQENCEKHDGHLYVGSTAEEMLTLKTAINNLGKCGTVNTVGIYI